MPYLLNISRPRWDTETVRIEDDQIPPGTENIPQYLADHAEELLNAVYDRAPEMVDITTGEQADERLEIEVCSGDGARLLLANNEPDALQVVVTGSPFDGLQVFGPFRDPDETERWTEGVKNDTWWIVDLHSPYPFAAPEPQKASA